jgi:hypothetical protein
MAIFNIYIYILYIYNFRLFKIELLFLLEIIKVN